MTETARTHPPTLEELRARRDEILEVAARHGVFDIRVFGSVARGDAHEGSDVDLLVDIEAGRSLLDLAGFHVDIQDLLACDVDVGTQIKPRLREEIEREVVAL
jgi:predicted nucleotidyltransferase